jgi:hypothetical protein
VNKSRLFYILTCAILTGCHSRQVSITREYMVIPGGVESDLTLHRLDVEKLDSTGMPTTYQLAERVDLELLDHSRTFDTVFLNRKDSRWRWSVNLSGPYDLMPLKFEQNSWYGIWSQQFVSGIFNTEKWHFLVFVDSNGTMSTFKVNKSSNL